MPEIHVNGTLCTGCGICVAICTGRVFRETPEGGEVAFPEACWLCGHCVAACPVDAIDHAAYPLEACPPIDSSGLPSFDQMVTALRERRSVRLFQDRPVPREMVQELLDQARWAPSANNAQPVDWLVFDDPGRIAALSAQAVAALAQTARLLRNRFLRPLLLLVYGAERVRRGLESVPSFERLAARHARGEDPIFFGAPVVLVAHVPADDYFGRDDAIYAAYNVMLVAQRMGLGTCQIGYFTLALDRSSGLRRALGLPPGRQAQVTLVLGYPRHRFRRLLPRRRPDILWNPR